MIQRTGRRKAQEQEFAIQSEYITLGQLIKALGLSDTGGSVKFFLEEAGVSVNGEADTRRGRKLRVGDTVAVQGEPLIRIVQGKGEESE